MARKYLKVNRTHSTLKRWSWILIPIIAIFGMFVPKLGLLLIPIMVTLMITGLLYGKTWCGNICPHASLFDHLLLPFAPIKKVPGLLKGLPLRYLFFAFYMGMFVVRVVNVSRLWGSLDFWDRLGFVFALNYLVPTLLGTVLALTINPRAWCGLCPMGTFQELMYKIGCRLGINRHSVRILTFAQDTCKNCGKCAQVCPMQLAPYEELEFGGSFEHEMCIKCGICVQNCPVKILQFRTVDQNKRKIATSA